LIPTELEAISIPYHYTDYQNIKKSKIQGRDNTVYVLVKRNAVEAGTNFLEAAWRHTAAGGTIPAKTLWAFGFNSDR
jgi:hypothetical protein